MPTSPAEVHGVEFAVADLGSAIRRWDSCRYRECFKQQQSKPNQNIPADAVMSMAATFAGRWPTRLYRDGHQLVHVGRGATGGGRQQLLTSTNETQQLEAAEKAEEQGEEQQKQTGWGRREIWTFQIGELYLNLPSRSRTGIDSWVAGDCWKPLAPARSRSSREGSAKAKMLLGVPSSFIFNQPYICNSPSWQEPFSGTTRPNITSF
jgi:hypothetical protein